MYLIIILEHDVPPPPPPMADDPPPPMTEAPPPPMTEAPATKKPKAKVRILLRIKEIILQVEDNLSDPKAGVFNTT